MGRQGKNRKNRRFAKKVYFSANKPCSGRIGADWA
jgi:hypothetical protein